MLLKHLIPNNPTVGRNGQSFQGDNANPTVNPKVRLLNYVIIIPTYGWRIFTIQQDNRMATYTSYKKISNDSVVDGTVTEDKLWYRNTLQTMYKMVDR